jgi:hypothetical protein
MQLALNMVKLAERDYRMPQYQILNLGARYSMQKLEKRSCEVLSIVANER